MAITHRFDVSAGHRNYDKGGAIGEYDWTYGCADAIRDAIEARGGGAVIVQEQDGDGDPDFFAGGLQAAARYCVSPIAAKLGPPLAYISCHYNGYPAGFHAIFPHARTGADIKANNPLDVRLCEVLVKHIRKTGTVATLGWTAHSPGVMSEVETGVGAKGFRLGEMVGTMGYRTTTARTILEAGGIQSSDSKYIKDPKWVRNVYAEAVVDALEEVFGAFSADAPEIPDVKPETPSDYPDPVVIPALNGIELKKGDTAHGVVDDEGTEYIFVYDVYRALRDTPRLRYADIANTSAANRVGPDIRTGEEFIVAWQVRAKDGKWYGITPFWTRVLTDPDEGHLERIADAPYAIDV